MVMEETVAITSLNLVTPPKRLGKKKTSRPKSASYRTASMTEEQFERLTVVQQVKHAFRPGSRIAAWIGLVMGGCAPIFTFGVVHFVLPHHPERSIILWVIAVGGLLFSAPKVYRWGLSAWGSKVEAVGTVMFLEGVMTFVPSFYLPMAALTTIIFVNGTYSACRLQIRKQPAA
jgi:hypothetical protein